MNDIRTKVAYLHGLAEGMDLEATSPEGRVLTSILDVMADIAEQITDVQEAQDELAEYIEDVDYDLGLLEEAVYGDEDDDEDDEEYLVPSSAVTEEEDGVVMITCPSCGETLAAGQGEGKVTLEVTCPVCGASMRDYPEPDKDRAERE